jgi:hypothetical protein
LIVQPSANTTALLTLQPAAMLPPPLRRRLILVDC